MKILTDVGVGRAVEEWLRYRGHDVLAIRDIDARMPDDEILEMAVRDGRLVITMDKDFGELVNLEGRPHAGVLLLRLDDAVAGEKVQVVKWVFEHLEDELTGNFTVYRRGIVRVRRP